MTIPTESLALLTALIVVGGMKAVLWGLERWPIRLRAQQPRARDRQPIP